MIYMVKVRQNGNDAIKFVRVYTVAMLGHHREGEGI